MRNRTLTILALIVILPCSSFAQELLPISKQAPMLERTRLFSSALTIETAALSPNYGNELAPVTKQAPLRSRLKVSLGGGPYLLNRKEYRLIQPQNQHQNLATQSPGEPFEYQTEGTGGFGSATIEFPIYKNYSIATRFLGAALENNQIRPVPGGTGSPQGSLIANGSVLPLLNELGKESNFGLVVEIGGKPNDFNATAETVFAYGTQQYDVALDLIRSDIFAKGNSHVDGLVGFGYTRINQNMDLHTTGINVNTLATTETNTSESLRDNLFGGRVGLRGHATLTKNISLGVSTTGGFYGGFTGYEGVQEFSNASFVGFAAMHDFTVVQNLRRNRFVPRLEVVTTLEYRLASNCILRANYRFDGIWELSNVDHPTARFNNQTGGGAGRDFIDHPVRIGSETLLQHFISLNLVLEF